MSGRRALPTLSAKNSMQLLGYLHQCWEKRNMVVGGGGSLTHFSAQALKVPWLSHKRQLYLQILLAQNCQLDSKHWVSQCNIDKAATIIFSIALSGLFLLPFGHSLCHCLIIQKQYNRTPYSGSRKHFVFMRTAAVRGVKSDLVKSTVGWMTEQGYWGI